MPPDDQQQSAAVPGRGAGLAHGGQQLRLAQAPQGHAERGRAARPAGRQSRAGVPAADHPSTTSRARRWSCRSTRCRAPSSRSSTSTAISRRRSPRQQFDQARRVDGSAQPAGAGQRQRRHRRAAGQAVTAGDPRQQAPRPHGAVRQHHFRDVGPGFGARAAQQLEADVKAGALGLGEIYKGFGLTARKTDGSRLKLDDPELDPIWQAAARLNIPVFIHTADPQEFFQPIDVTQRALAGAGAVPRSPLSVAAEPVVRRADGGARPAVPPPSEDDVHRRPPGVARQRPGATGQDVRRDAERLRRGRRRPLRPRPPAARRHTTSS